MRRILTTMAIILSALAASTDAAVGGEIGFLEDFSLAPERSVPLKQLIPGTEDFYYYHALHFQNTEQFAKVDELLGPWVQRHGETQRVWEIRTRQALLTYDQSADKSLQYLRTRLNLHFNHQKEQLNQEPNLPIVLDQKLISRQRLLDQTAMQRDHLNAFEDSALDWLVSENLSPERRRALLQRLARPDYPNLPQLVVQDLNHPISAGFGAFPIHRQLLLAQLEECLKLKPDLLNQTNFVQAYLAKLQPAADDDWRRDPKVLQAYIERLWKFVEKLSPSHNSLKAHVLYHWLVLDRQRGTYSKERFLAYLQLPRHQPYVAPKFLERDESRRFAVDLNADFVASTLLGPIGGGDEALVRSYLMHFFVDAKNYQEFEPYLQDLYLKRLFAETKIVHGLGEAEQWASLLPPEQFQQLKERVDIDFAFTNSTSYTADQPVRLDLHVKNVSTLIVKVFEVNTRNYYRQFQREVDTDVNLDGLVANLEQTHNYAEPALRRVTRSFSFDSLSKPGVYVVDFIGNGRSSRALIRKGKLRHVVTTIPSGQMFTVFDEDNRLVPDARIWLAGHEYAAEKDGTIVVPFSTAPGRQPIVLERGDFASLDHFQHEAENYSLAAGIYVDREALLARKKARVIVRPGLSIGGAPVSLTLLEDVKLVITSTDHDGVSTTQESPDFKLYEDRESTYEFQVPARLASINFTLAAKVKKQTAGGQKIDVTAGESFTLNAIDKTEKVEDLHLLKIENDYWIEVLGKTGEPRASRPVQLQLKHRDFKQQVYVTLKSDADGRAKLGPLADIVGLTATGAEQTARTWTLTGDRHSYSRTLHGRTGQTLTLPFLPKELSRDQASLLELRGETFTVDRFSHLSLKNGLLSIDKLPAGDFDLLLKQSGARLRIRIVEGEKVDGYVLGNLRTLETRPLAPVQIETVEAKAEKLTIQLRNTSQFVRVHLFATRYWPAYSSYQHLAQVADVEPTLFIPGRAESAYLTGRNIGDEYRYILDRRYAKKYPGNMLDRPSLLLNPWAVRATETSQQVAQGGDDFGAVAAKQDGRAERLRSELERGAADSSGFSNLDFLSQASAVLVNLVPDENGVVTIDRAAIGQHQHLHVVAVDPLNTTYRGVALPEAKPIFVDLRMLDNLDPQAHFTQQKQISVVESGKPFEQSDITTGKFEAYDSLAAVYALYVTLSHDPKLTEFGFLMKWPSLKDDEKRAQYSKFASHELSFFLAKKDPEFFKSVIKPYLANKKDKTFLDRWLLEENLRDYLQPWNYGQLNTFEKTLLARRIEGERPITSRHIADQVALLAPDVDRFIHLFDTAVKGSALEADDRLGLRQAAAAAKPGMVYAPRTAELAAAAPSAPPPGMAGRLGNAMRDEARKKVMEMDAVAEKSKGAIVQQSLKDLQKRAEKAREASDQTFGDAKAADKDGAALNFRRSANREQMRQLYRKLDKTMEWAENNYYHLTIQQQTAALITANAFWKDYAAHDPAKPFLSRNLAEASHNFSEMLAALALLDLPFEAPKHETRFEGARMTLVPGGPIVVYHEEIRPAKPNAGAAPILVSQNFFRHGDRHRMENGEKIDKFVTEEFLVHAVYGCQIVVTNPTSNRQKLSLLLQIPEGAMPVLNSQATRTVHLTLEPYQTHTLDYHFYFPQPGQFDHFPVHVAKNEELVAFAAPFKFQVVHKPTKIDTLSWEHVSQHGSPDEVIAFLNQQNIHSLNLDKIAFRMRDVGFFKTTTGLLARRHVYSHVLWSYSLLHNAVDAAREFLQHADQIVQEAGGPIRSSLLTVDPVARRTFEHLEYKPLVNARAHSLGKRRQILNDRFHAQYHATLKQFGYLPRLSDADWMAVTYYLLLQDRVDDALESFARVNVDRLATRMQYDYFAAYLDFYVGSLPAARAIAQKYADHPVDRWRNAFATIVAQLDESEGKDAKAIDAEDRGQQQTELAATEPNFDFQVEAKQIVVNHQNLDSVRVNYYLMDVELLFSRNPFVQQFSGQFSSIRPNHVQTVDLKPAPAESGKKGESSGTNGTSKIPLPESLHNKNVLVEITGGGQTKTQAYYSHALSPQVIANYGQVRVTHQTTGKPVAKAYVKVYAQMQNGSVRFYKDGYTDIRGRFDYSSLSTDDLDEVQKFSLLVMSDEHGAVVREAQPPKR